MKKDKSLLLSVLLIVVSSILIIFLFIFFLSYFSGFDYRTEQMVVQVDEKNIECSVKMIHSGNCLIPITEYEYKIKSDDHILTVDEDVYKSIEIGDRIVINKIYRYYKKDGSINKIYYEYAGE